MARLEVQSALVGVYEGPAYMENSEDGPVAVWDCFAAVSVNGRELVHLVPFRQWHDAERLVERIRAAGVIDTDHWYDLPSTSLEERFAMYADREQEARMGLRGEDDLYD